MVQSRIKTRWSNWCEEITSNLPRYFTFGIGRGASRGLIEDTAKASGGAFEMIDDIDISSGKVGDKVLRQLTS